MTSRLSLDGCVDALCTILLVTILLAPSVSYPATYNVDTSSAAPLTGLWWNEAESGWGVTLTQQYEVVFVTIFTYDTSGLPIWYVASNCVIVGNGCRGELYKVSGGSIITSSWDDAAISVEAVGNVSFTFSDNDTGIMDFTIDGVAGNKAITRQVWSTLSPGAPMTALWWNELESGWGVTLTQQSDIAFATIFTYDTNGFPTWFIASNCSVSDSTCSGELYGVTGGSPLTESWNGDNLVVTSVGNIEVLTMGQNAGATNFDIDGIFGLKTIARQVWALDDDGDEVSNNFDAYPDDPLRSVYDVVEVADAAISNLATESGLAILIAYDSGFSLRQIVAAILANTLSSDGDISSQSPALAPQSFVSFSVVEYLQTGSANRRQAVADDHPAIDFIELGGRVIVGAIFLWADSGFNALQIFELVLLTDWGACANLDDYKAEACAASIRSSIVLVGEPKIDFEPSVFSDSEPFQPSTSDSGDTGSSTDSSPQDEGVAWVYEGGGTLTYENILRSGRTTICEGDSMLMRLELNPDGSVEFTQLQDFKLEFEDDVASCVVIPSSHRFFGTHSGGTYSTTISSESTTGSLNGSYDSITASGSGERVFTFIGTVNRTYSFQNLPRN